MFSFILIILYFLILLFFFVMAQLNVIGLAFAKIGIPPEHIFTALFLTLIGSFINIPVKRIPQETMAEEGSVSFFGIRYRIPRAKKPEMVLAINVGGAIIPTLISIYLLFKSGLWVKGLVVTGIMTLLSYWLARPVKGVGIAMPAFIPPLAAALLAVLFSRDYAPVLAYIGGTLGTLIGADIMNLDKIKDLGAPVASIGGAGTFDGIFLSGIMGVILAAILT